MCCANTLLGPHAAADVARDLTEAEEALSDGDTNAVSKVVAFACLQAQLRAEDRLVADDASGAGSVGRCDQSRG